MENNNDSFPFYQFPEEAADVHINPMITCPDDVITTWDDVINHDSHLTGSRENVQMIDFRDANRKGKQPETSEEVTNRGGNTNHAAVQKKIMHRDVEKQRRQEMATLFASLRSVVPARFLKGKHSVSDQIHEATSYIRCLQRNIRALGAKRDNIKAKSSTLQESSDQRERCNTMASKFSVSAKPCSVGVEVVIAGDFLLADGLIALPVSRVLKLLSEEGLVFVCCNWTNSDGKLHYVIQSEVLDYADVNLQSLQRKLNGMINSLIDINMRLEASFGSSVAFRM